MTQQNQRIVTVIVSVLLGLIIGYLFGQATPRHMSEGMHQMSDGSMMKNDAPSMRDTHQAMDHSSMVVDSERDFITMMISHHEEAVDTAREVLERGATTPEIKTLMENIITAQEKEIADMQQWHAAWYGEAYQPADTYVPMMRDLSSLSGTDIDQAFLEDMIPHHMGAIMMARSVAPHIEHEEIRTLTQAIIESQSQEIQMMQDLLKRL